MTCVFLFFLHIQFLFLLSKGGGEAWEGKVGLAAIGFCLEKSSGFGSMLVASIFHL